MRNLVKIDLFVSLNLIFRFAVNGPLQCKHSPFMCVTLKQSYMARNIFYHAGQLTEMQTVFMACKEYVASLIGLYKNNGAVSYVGINFHFIGPLYHAPLTFHGP